MSKFKHLIPLLKQYEKNGVVPLSVVKKSNPPLGNYIKDNFDLFAGLQFIIINDVQEGKLTYENLKLWLKYFYGDVVDLSDLNKNKKTYYNYLRLYGKPEDVLTEMGFDIVYKSKSKKSDMVYIVHEFLNTSPGSEKWK
ncbi:MAG: hypothetical protein QJR05_04570, partial [Thermoanaerobacterium sp.]|nr:hypothetical protein [Thermoanaerobacterium sp.]